jgi:hypothetical protein
VSDIQQLDADLSRYVSLGIISEKYKLMLLEQAIKEDGE